jgi:hypothetical protein
MKECILNIKLMKRPATRYCNRQNKINGGSLYYRTERIFIIDSITLLPFSNKSSLIFIQCAICLPFNLEYPHTINNVHTSLRSNQVPCSILQEGAILNFHGALPIWITECFCNSMRFRNYSSRITISYSPVSIRFGLAYPMLKACH